MNRSIILSLFILASTLVKGQTESTQAAPQTGKIYFLRSTGYTGSAQGFTVFIDDTVVCKLNNKRFSIHNVASGIHSFSVQFAGKTSKEKAERIEINIEAGKTYYIQLIFQSGFFANNLYCQEVTENSAKTIMNKLTEDNKCL